MIRFRPFLNTDPPHLVQIWNAQAPLRVLARPLSVELLENYVLSKPYFDRQGLVVVVDESDHVLGFGHAGFAASEDRTTLSRQTGAVCMLAAAPPAQHGAVASGAQVGDAQCEDILAGLCSECESYLRQRGAEQIHAMGALGANPFYQGLYGGSGLLGVAASDPQRLNLFRRAGFEESSRYKVMQRSLSPFRSLVDRQQIQIRRSHMVEPAADSPPRDWWQACVLGPTELTRFLLQARGRGPVVGSALFCDLEAYAAHWGVRAAGLVGLEVTPDRRRQGLATYLLGESMRQLQAIGVGLVEAQVPSENLPIQQVLDKLQFEQVDEVIGLCK